MSISSLIKFVWKDSLPCFCLKGFLCHSIWILWSLSLSATTNFPANHPNHARYDLDFKSPTNDGSLVVTGAELGDIFADLSKKYPIVSIEDPFDQDDWENYAAFTAQVGEDVQVNET